MNFYSQFGQDKFVYETFFKDKKNGVFLEIGADDGIRFSNCKFFEESMDWNGIAIEARKIAYEKLVKNRKCICLNTVLSDRIEETEFLQLNGYGLGLSGLINKYDPRHVTRIENEKKNKDHLGSDIIMVNTERLDNILNNYNYTYIDFLSIDTEGSELDILKTIDFNKYYIDVITIEDNYKDKKIIDFFENNNYYLVGEIECDKIFKKRV